MRRKSHLDHKYSTKIKNENQSVFIQEELSKLVKHSSKRYVKINHHLEKLFFLQQKFTTKVHEHQMSAK